MDTEFQDWELLNSNSASDSEHTINSPKNHDAFTETEGLIKANYFSLDSQNTITDGSERGSEESDNPSWVEPGSETQFLRKNNSGGFLSDSGSERSEDRKFVEFEGKEDLGFDENLKLQVGFEGISEKVGDFGVFEGKSEVGFDENSKLQVGLGGISEKVGDFGEFEGKSEVGFEGIEEMSNENGKNVEKVWTDTGGIGKSGENETFEGEKRDEIVEVKASKVGEEKRSMVWWKVPLELLKYCVFRVRPMWAFSVAAAVMGFVLLGRRLYKMKKKTKGLELKVTVDDKKVSQFMSRAARLNEAFSVVKRVPVIRPQLPAPGVSPWPMVSLR